MKFEIEWPEPEWEPSLSHVLVKNHTGDAMGTFNGSWKLWTVLPPTPIQERAERIWRGESEAGESDG